MSSEFFSIRTSTDFFIRTLAWLYRDSIWIPIPIYQYTDTDDTEVGRVNHSKKKSPTPLKKVTKKSQKIKISQKRGKKVIKRQKVTVKSQKVAGKIKKSLKKRQKVTVKKSKSYKKSR